MMFHWTDNYRFRITDQLLQYYCSEFALLAAYAFLSYHSKTILLFRVTVTLTFDQVTSKSIGLICESWSMFLWSFMILGPSVLELSSDNHLVDGQTDRQTDRPTDRPTCAKQYTPFSSKGGIIIIFKDFPDHKVV